MTDKAEINDYFFKFTDEIIFNNKASVQECFNHFDENSDDALDMNEFQNLLEKLFSFNGNPYPIPITKITEIFNYFDSDNKNLLSFSNFKNFWFKMIKPTLFPRTSLIIVDVQNDFIDGKLALINCPAKHDGADVIPYINELIDTVPFDVIAYTLDWHPVDHCSFIENVHLRKLNSKSPKKENIQVFDSVIFEEQPDIVMKLWPAHCVQGTRGSELHKNLKVVDTKSDPMKREVVYAYKGSSPDLDEWSGFLRTNLNKDLNKHGVTDVYVCGIAADICVAYTANDALDLKYRVVYVQDATKGVDSTDIACQKTKLASKGALIVNTDQVKNMVMRRDRRPELAYAAFSNLAN